jgi:hypothetical protein
MNGNVGIGTWVPSAVLQSVTSDGSGVAYLMTGKASDGTIDNANGVAITLTNNASTNRQFTIGDSASKTGIRIIGQAAYTAMDSFNWNTGFEQAALELQSNGGNLGIGTYNPGSTLSVLGGVALGSYAVSVAPAGGIIASGNVGIGTTIASNGGLLVMNGNVGIGTWVPAATFHVVGSTTQGVIFDASSIGTALRVRANAASRYRSDFNISSAGLNINSYDDTGAVYLPFSYNTASTQMNSINSNGTGIFTFAGPTAGGDSYATLDELRISGNDTANTIYQGSGAMGIKTANAALTIGAGGSNSLIFTTSGVNAVTIDGNQNVGIGSVNPIAKLNVVYNGNGITDQSLVGNVFVGYTVLNNTGAGFSTYALGSTYGNTFFGGVTGNNQSVIEANSLSSSFYLGTNNSIPIILAPNRVAAMTIIGGGNVGIGTTTPAGGLTVMNGNVGIGTWVPATTFQVNGSTQNLYVTSAGNVGIGTVNPVSPLQVYSSSPEGMVITETNGNNTLAFRNISTPNTDAWIEYLAGASNNLSFWSNGLDTTFLTGGGITLNTGNLLLSSGNIGIGTTTPAQALSFGATGALIRMRDSNGVSWVCGPAVTTGVFTCTAG